MGPRAYPGPSSATAPDLWTVGCQLDHGHHGPHRNNQTIWHDPDPVDVTTNTDHWRNGQVHFTWQEPAA